MYVNGLIVHHDGSRYRICLPKGAVVFNGMVVNKETPICQIDFSRNGDSLVESKKIAIFVRHMKEAYQMKSGF